MKSLIVDVAGRPIASTTQRRVVLNPDRRAVHCAPAFDRPRLRQPRTYQVSTVAESLVIQYGPRIFRSIGRPRGGQRFA